MDNHLFDEVATIIKIKVDTENTHEPCPGLHSEEFDHAFGFHLRSI